MIIKMRLAVLLLPIYVVLMAVTDAVFKSAKFTTTSNVPWWVIAGFTLTAVAVFVIVTRYLVRKSRGQIPVQRERAATGFVVALIASSFVDDALKAVTSLIFHSTSIWLSIPLYVISYVVLLTLVVFFVNKFSAKPDPAQPPLS